MNHNDIKPKIFVSQCIEHGHCRYDGSQISSNFVKKLEPYVIMVTACPEQSIGLGVPREAIRIIKEGDDEKLVYSLTGTEVTESMVQYTNNYLDELEKEELHGFILKSRSPSCGIKDVKVYKTFGKAPSVGKTVGFFGGEVTRRFEGLAIEDEGRLTNYNIREHFLTRIYTLAAFDEVEKEASMKKLVQFQSENKYLLMAYHQKNQKLLGKIVANHEKLPVVQVIQSYKELLKKSLLRPLRRGTNINMLMHLFGYFKNELTKDEKAYFLEVLEQYSVKKIPLSVPIALVNAWVIRFDEKYLAQQTIFRPYPLEILEVTDSGKGID